MPSNQSTLSKQWQRRMYKEWNVKVHHWNNFPGKLLHSWYNISQQSINELARLQLLPISISRIMKYSYSFTHPMPPALLPWRFCTRMSLICPINSSLSNQSSHSCPAIWITEERRVVSTLRPVISLISLSLSLKLLGVAVARRWPWVGFQGFRSKEMLVFGSRIAPVKLLCFSVTQNESFLRGLEEENEKEMWEGKAPG